MESVGTLYGGEWSSFNGTPNEESDFMAQLLGNYSYSSEQYGVTNVGAPSTFWPSHHEPSIGGSEGSYYCSDTFISNNGLFPQGSSYSNDTSYYQPSSGHQDYYVNDSNQIPTSMDYNMVGEQNTRAFTNNVIEEGICTNEETTNASFGASGGSPVESVALTVSKMQNKRKLKMLDLPTASEDPKMQVRKNKKNTPKGKKQKFEEEEATVGLNGQSSCSYSSEDDSNASQELNGGTTSSSKGSGSLNQSGKARASRGSATDPQSLYARKRRERINERLRILQNLVPNGTKVDISTMLEEAVEYVKFLQLQIKLLSSDDMWMYAPIAYNGMNIGLHNLNIPQSQ